MFSPELSNISACLKALSQHAAHPFVPWCTSHSSLTYHWSLVVLLLSLQKVQLPSNPHMILFFIPCLYWVPWHKHFHFCKIPWPQPQPYSLVFDTSPRARSWKCWLVLGHLGSFPHFCGSVCSRIWSSCFPFCLSLIKVVSFYRASIQFMNTMSASLPVNIIQPFILTDLHLKSLLPPLPLQEGCSGLHILGS